MLILTSNWHTWTSLSVVIQVSSTRLVAYGSKSTPVLVKIPKFWRFVPLWSCGFLHEVLLIFSPDLFEKNHSYPTNKISKICWGDLSKIDFSKVPIAGGMLWNFPRQIGGKSQYLSSCVKPITLLLLRWWFYNKIEIYYQGYWFLFTFQAPGWSHRVNEYPSFGENSQILAICTMMIMWVLPWSDFDFSHWTWLKRTIDTLKIKLRKFVGLPCPQLTFPRSQLWVGCCEILPADTR